jgi:hypothetical protein
MKPMNVNGAILTGKAIEKLKGLQLEGNTLLNEHIKTLHRAIKHIISDSVLLTDDTGERRREVIWTVYNINHLCDTLENLYAVENEPD